MATAQTVFGLRAPHRVACMNLQGSAYTSERFTAAPLSYHADATHERFTFQSEASARISFGSAAWGTTLTEPPGRWSFGTEASTAPSVPLVECLGCPPSPMSYPSDPVLCDLNMRDHCAVAPPQTFGSDDEMEEEDDDNGDDDDDDDTLPSKMLLYPATDDEGEPQEKAAWELWPVRAPKPRRNSHARPPTTVLAQAPGLPGPAARAILGTRPCEARQPAVGRAAPLVVACHPPGIHTFPAAKVTVAAPAMATGVTMATLPVTAPAAQGTQANVAYEWQASRRARRASQPRRITTLVVRNLDINTTKQEFLDEVNRSGFVEKYDYAYLPRNFENGLGKGHAFINFLTPDAASTFVAAWHRSRHLSAMDEFGQVVPLNVSTAILQGLEANLRQWTCARVARVKNGDFLPFVLRDAEPAPRASGPGALGSAADAARRPR